MNVSLYLQIVPIRHRWDPDRITDVRLAKMTKTAPTGDSIVPEARVVKVVVDVPPEQFLMQAVGVEAPVPPAVKAVAS